MANINDNRAEIRGHIRNSLLDIIRRLESGDFLDVNWIEYIPWQIESLYQVMSRCFDVEIVGEEVIALI